MSRKIPGQQEFAAAGSTGGILGLDAELAGWRVLAPFVVDTQEAGLGAGRARAARRGPQRSSQRVTSGARLQPRRLMSVEDVHCLESPVARAVQATEEGARAVAAPAAGHAAFSHRRVVLWNRNSSVVTGAPHFPGEVSGAGITVAPSRELGPGPRLGSAVRLRAPAGVHAATARNVPGDLLVARPCFALLRVPPSRAT